MSIIRQSWHGKMLCLPEPKAGSRDDAIMVVCHVSCAHAVSAAFCQLLCITSIKAGLVF